MVAYKFPVEAEFFLWMVYQAQSIESESPQTYQNEKSVLFLPKKLIGYVTLCQKPRVLRSPVDELRSRHLFEAAFRFNIRFESYLSVAVVFTNLNLELLSLTLFNQEAIT